jgi:hypothetical protein
VKEREEGDHVLLLCVPNTGFDLKWAKRNVCVFLKQSGPLCACLDTQHHVIIGHFSSPIRDFQSLNFIQNVNLPHYATTPHVSVRFMKPTFPGLYSIFYQYFSISTENLIIIFYEITQLLKKNELI